MSKTDKFGRCTSCGTKDYHSESCYFVGGSRTEKQFVAERSEVVSAFCPTCGSNNPVYVRDKSSGRQFELCSDKFHVVDGGARPDPHANYLQLLPGGTCFAHGPYTEMQCPKWPACITDPQKPEYMKKTTDAVAILHKRYVGDDPLRLAQLEAERALTFLEDIGFQNLDIHPASGEKKTLTELLSAYKARYSGATDGGARPDHEYRGNTLGVCVHCGAPETHKNHGATDGGARELEQELYKIVADDLAYARARKKSDSWIITTITKNILLAMERKAGR
jgi:hypothetical protein